MNPATLRSAALPLCLGAVVFMLPGCVQRTISITSEPSGALVYLNDEEVGRTPVRVPFTFYGNYDVRLEAEGHQPLWTSRKANPPLWEHPGPDLFAELVPGARVNLQWHFDLERLPPVEERSVEALEERASALREQLARTPVPKELEQREADNQAQPDKATGR